MRPRTTLIAAVIIATVLGSGAADIGGPTAALASSGTVIVSPATKLTAWNATAFSIDVSAQSVVTTTQCLTDPNNASSPTLPCGLGAFDFTLTWDPAKVAFVSITGGAMLTSTGREMTCFAPVFGTGSVQFQCVTSGFLPMGPQGSGVLASVTFDPIVPAVGDTMPLALSDVVLLDIQGTPFPGTPVGGTVQFGVCADVNGSGGVGLADTLAILAHFGESAPPADIKYDPAPFPIRNGSIGLADAFYSLQQFGQTCTYP